MRKYVAELLGTFILVALGGFSVVAGASVGVPPLLTAPFGFGLGLLAAIWAVGHVSGGHFNPAVTVAMLLDRRISGRDTLGYVVAQTIGGILAAYAVVIATWGPASEAATFINNGLGTQNHVGPAFLLEAVLTAVFVAVILVSTKTGPDKAGIVIPLTLTAVHFGAVPFTGGSFNPARAIGPAVAAGTFDALWVVVVAPLVGAVIAWVVLMAMRPEPATA